MTATLSENWPPTDCSPCGPGSMDAINFPDLWPHQMNDPWPQTNPFDTDQNWSFPSLWGITAIPSDTYTQAPEAQVRHPKRQPSSFPEGEPRRKMFRSTYDHPTPPNPDDMPPVPPFLGSHTPLLTLSDPRMFISTADYHTVVLPNYYHTQGVPKSPQMTAGIPGDLELAHIQPEDEMVPGSDSPRPRTRYFQTLKRQSSSPPEGEPLSKLPKSTDENPTSINPDNMPIIAPQASLQSCAPLSALPDAGYDGPVAFTSHTAVQADSATFFSSYDMPSALSKESTPAASETTQTEPPKAADFNTVEYPQASFLGCGDLDLAHTQPEESSCSYPGSPLEMFPEPPTAISSLPFYEDMPQTGSGASDKAAESDSENSEEGADTPTDMPWTQQVDDMILQLRSTGSSFATISSEIKSSVGIEWAANTLYARYRRLKRETWQPREIAIFEEQRKGKPRNSTTIAAIRKALKTEGYFRSRDSVLAFWYKMETPRSCQPWQPYETVRALEMKMEGLSRRQISKAMGRAETTVARNCKEYKDMDEAALSNQITLLKREQLSSSPEGKPLSDLDLAHGQPEDEMLHPKTRQPRKKWTPKDQATVLKLRDAGEKLATIKSRLEDDWPVSSICRAYKRWKGDTWSKAEPFQQTAKLKKKHRPEEQPGTSCSPEGEPRSKESTPAASETTQTEPPKAADSNTVEYPQASFLGCGDLDLAHTQPEELYPFRNPGSPLERLPEPPTRIPPVSQLKASTTQEPRTGRKNSKSGCMTCK